MSTSPSTQTPAVIGEKRERVEEPSSTPAAASPAATTPSVAEPPVAKAPPKTILRMKSASKTPTASNAASPILIRPPPPAAAGPIRRISSASSPLLGLPSLSVRSASVILGGTTRNVGETPATPTTPGSPQSFSSTTISLSSSVSGMMPNKEHRFAPALIRALQAEADSMEVAPEYLLELTEEISRCMSQEVDPTSAMQTLYPFLKDAASTVLRRDIISGKRSPQSLVRLTETELMSQEAMAKEEAAAKRRMMDRDQEELNKSTAMNSTMFKCAKCGKRDTSYYEKQVRSADEPMTLFIGCNICRHRWRIG